MSTGCVGVVLPYKNTEMTRLGIRVAEHFTLRDRTVLLHVDGPGVCNVSPQWDVKARQSLSYNDVHAACDTLIFVGIPDLTVVRRAVAAGRKVIGMLWCPQLLRDADFAAASRELHAVLVPSPIIGDKVKGANTLALPWDCGVPILRRRATSQSRYCVSLLDEQPNNYCSGTLHVVAALLRAAPDAVCRVLWRSSGLSGRSRKWLLQYAKEFSGRLQLYSGLRYADRYAHYAASDCVLHLSLDDAWGAVPCDALTVGASVVMLHLPSLSWLRAAPGVWEVPRRFVASDGKLLRIEALASAILAAAYNPGDTVDWAASRRGRFVSTLDSLL